MKSWFAGLIVAPLCVVGYIAVVPASADTTADRIDEMIRNPLKPREAHRAEQLDELRQEYDGWSRDELLEELLDLRNERDELSSDVDRLHEELDPPRQERRQ
ncbi:hypothetical protein [Nitratireductor luteus]|uniref:hypothetical protein n=1 Tax=Nitratireductor luteus TaxID=2976980 RepID=UPI00223F8902|nr:hypothetical protein [Nitratireductor luteus]